MSKQPEYDTESLEASIAHAKKTIKTFKQGIADQEALVKEYRAMIETIQRKQKLSEGIVLDASQ